MLIGIAGKARSGKDTFATMLAECLFDVTGNRFVMMAFANELKKRIQIDFDLSYDQLWGDHKEVEDRRYPINDRFWTAREIMQSYGEFFRSIDYNFWINNLFRTISDKEYDNVIVTDVRHTNEAEAILSNGGVLVRVDAANRSTSTVHGSSHISENELDDFNRFTLVVNNNKGLNELKQEAALVASEIIKLK